MLIIPDYLRNEGQHKIEQRIDYPLPSRHCFCLISGFPKHSEFKVFSKSETSSMKGIKSTQHKCKYNSTSSTKLKQKWTLWDGFCNPEKHLNAQEADCTYFFLCLTDNPVLERRTYSLSELQTHIQTSLIALSNLSTCHHVVTLQHSRVTPFPTFTLSLLSFLICCTMA